MDDTVYCNEDGVQVVCPLGCSDTGGAHCKVVVYSNGADDTYLTGVTADWIIAKDRLATIYTDEASIVSNGEVIRQPIADEVHSGMGFYFLSDTLAVLAVKSLTVESGGTVRASGGRALIILSAGDVLIDGVIDVSAGCTDGNPECGGPGGGHGATDTTMASGCGPGGNGVGEVDGGLKETGGGGGAFGEPGGAGGPNSDTEPGGEGGVTDGCPNETLMPLVGGSGGGEGGDGDGKDSESGWFGGNGGGGGGALQVTSKARIIFGKGGEIWAGGGGGAPGINGNGGGGGGSGGAILLEAPEIKAAGAILTANGGGGGGGRTGAEAGEKGTRTTTQAAGGEGGANGGNDYRGGLGGSYDGAAWPGAGGGDGTGGGGGGVGIIRINVPADKLDITNATISPAHTRGDPAAQ